MGKVLVVDDEDDFLVLVGQFLEETGIECVLADSMTQAQKHLGRTQFDLVISDLNMPGESGFDLFRFVSSRYPEVKFAIMTGYGDSRTRSEASSMGVDAYIEKPFTFSDLMQIVNNLAPDCTGIKACA